MRLLTWNVQWCRGIDGRVDPARIAAEARRLADPDIACFQEVAANFPGLGVGGLDEAAELSSHFPGYEAVFAAGVDLPAPGGGRSRFGNLLLSRLPLGRVAAPCAALARRPEAEHAARRRRSGRRGARRPDPRHHHAPGVLLERPPGDTDRAAARSPRGRLQPAGARRGRRPLPLAALAAGRRRSAATSTFRPTTRCTSASSSPSWRAIRASSTPGRSLHPGAPHPPTFRLYERDEGQSPYCCDYFFVTHDLAPRLKSIAHRRRDAGFGPPAGHPAALISARSSSTRRRLTPKSRRPRREAERTWMRFPSAKNSTSSTKRSSGVRNSAYR